MEKKNTKIEIKITKWHVLTSLFIIGIRALQPNAEPMSEWSFLSWFLMTLPFMFGAYLFLIMGFLYVISNIIDNMLENH